MIPLIIGGVTLAVVGYAIKEFCEEECPYNPLFASNDSNTRNSNDTSEELNTALWRLNTDKLQISQKFHNLKIDIYDTSFKEFNTLFSQIQNIDLGKVKYNYQNFEKIVTINNDSVSVRVESLNKVLNKLNKLFETYNKKLGYIVLHSNDYSAYVDKDRETVRTAFSLATIISKICHVDFLTEDGQTTKKSKKILEKANFFLKEMK